MEMQFLTGLDDS